MSGIYSSTGFIYCNSAVPYTVPYVSESFYLFLNKRNGISLQENHSVKEFEAEDVREISEVLS